MKIYTSYFGNFKNIPQEYQCVSIANSQPMNLPQWTVAAPKWNIVNKYKSFDISYKEFKQIYQEQLSKSIDIIKVHNFLNRFNEDTIVLLCWEKDALHCHRRILAECLGKMLKIDVEEL